MMYITTYESNHGDYILSSFEEEFNHDYRTNYNGVISRFDMTEKEFYEKYKLYSGNIFQNLSEYLQKVVTDATITYKQEELQVKAIEAFIEYNENRDKEYLLRLAEIEAFNYVHFHINSVVLDKIAARNNETVVKLVAHLMSGAEAHKNLVVDYSDSIEELSVKISTLSFEELYSLNIDDELVKILTPVTGAFTNLSYDDTIASNMEAMRAILDTSVNDRANSSNSDNKKKTTKRKNFDSLRERTERTHTAK